MARMATPKPAARQGGAALLVIFLIILLAGMSMFFQRLNGAPDAARGQQTAAALAQARDALIGYAASYADTHPGQVFGFLPCPDIDNDGSAETCDQMNLTVVGRLPWKTLDLPDLRDADGECLWYAVSGSFKNNPPPGLLNWDSAGKLRVVDAASGQTLVAADDLAGSDGGAAAVIFAPGPPLAGQERPNGNQTCSGTTANNYAAYVDSGSFPASGIATVKQGRRGDATANDQLLWITPREIFARIHQRNDFQTQTNAFLGQIASALSSLPSPTNPLMQGSKVVGSVPNSQLGTDTLKEWAKKWDDQLRYLVCMPLSACLAVNNPGSTLCRGAIVFSGERTGGGPRSTAQKALLSSYFEGDTLAALSSSASTLTGSASYTAATPTTDVVLCIP